MLLAVSPLIAAEVYVRATYRPIDLWALTGRKASTNPMSDWAVADAFSAYRGRPGTYPDGKTVNQHGFISTPELTVEKPERTLRIAFLGGSSTAGTGHNLADEDTWPWQATELLRDRVEGYRVEFINAALGGYTTFESYGRLWSRIRFFSPDIIVVDHAWNEMYYFGRVDEMSRWRTRPDGSWGIETTTQPIVQHEPLAIDHLIYPSQLLTRLRFRYFPTPRSGEATPATAALAPSYDRRGLDIFRTNLRLLREAARVMNAEIFVVKQPTLIVPDLPAEERARARYEFHGFDHAAHVDAFRQIYRVIDEEIDPGNVIDATGISGIPALFHDHVHPTPAGAMRLARIVAERLALTPFRSDT